MEPQTSGGRERRAYPRYELVLAVTLAVQQPGFPAHRISATTINLSRGGVLLKVNKLVLEGARCQTTFEDAGDLVEPQTAAGRVLYRRSQGSDQYAVVVQFDEPLDAVNIEDGATEQVVQAG